MKNLVEVAAKHTPIRCPWNELSKEQKRREIVRFAHRHHGHALTLNLGPAFATYLSAKKTPMREVNKRMNAALHQSDLHHLPIMMVLEATRATSRIHLHGVYIGGGLPKSVIQETMRKAVGFIAGRSGSRQFHSKLLFNADGWTGYLRKEQSWTSRLLELSSEDRLWWVSRSMTQLVRDDYEAVFNAQKAAAANTYPLAPAA